MTRIIELDELLKSMSPEIKSGEYVFCTVDGNYSDYAIKGMDMNCPKCNRKVSGSNKL